MTEKSQVNWTKIIQIGLIGGAVAILLCLVGMVEAFSKRDIIAGVISLGQILLVIIVFTIGYTGAKRASSRDWRISLVSGIIAGLLVGSLIAGLVLLSKGINLRPVLVNASPALFKILTFDQKTTAMAVLYLVAGGAGVGLIAGLLYILPARIRSAIIAGLIWVILVGLLQDLIRLTLTPWPQVANAVSWIFGARNQKGLSVIGAVVIFIVVTGGNFLWAGWKPTVQTRYQGLPASRQNMMRYGSLFLIALVLLYLPNLLGPFLSEVATTVGLYILMGLGLNIVVGFAGLLDLGYVAFFAIGAYVMGVLTTTGGELTTSAQWTFWEALPVAVLASVTAGVILGVPVLHIRGDYLAIVTLGFGEIIRILALSDMLKPHIGGSQGIVQVARASIGGIAIDNAQKLYYLILVACLIGAFIALRLKDSRPGRAWMAMREDEDVAQAMGIDLVVTKLMAFGVGAGFSGLSGAIFASKLATIYPHSFNLLISINVLALIIVGGMGSIPGVVVGALALVGLPELLREFDEFRLMVYGAVLVAMMLYRPEGLWPEKTRQRELHAQEDVPITENAVDLAGATSAATGGQ
ncbi:MAG: leucine/isoleucine/valine transporter permease subunit [Anaerolineae bacterium]|nr:leucine/isoleucine/valine transporter permease subunit [Anaerolineales bacterium]MCQ3976568.1 leucine/isoleucine/valine transporter permease subunit [Anaerolineae bacterium]